MVVIDDSPAIRARLHKALRKQLGASVEIAEYDRGDDALRDFAGLDPDMVFIESEPLGVEAYDMVQAILLDVPEMPVVAVTELPREAEPIQELLSYGLFRILRKPIQMPAVEDLLQEVRDERLGAGRIR